MTNIIITSARKGRLFPSQVGPSTRHCCYSVQNSQYHFHFWQLVYKEELRPFSTWVSS